MFKKETIVCVATGPRFSGEITETAVEYGVKKPDRFIGYYYSMTSDGS